jgi:peptide/nickel transport system substrate-binding protein
VRQALAYAVDYERILRIQYNGYADVNPSPFSSVSWTTPANLKPYAHDAAKALALLAQAGYSAGADGKMTKDGRTLTFTLATYNGSHARAVCTLIAEDLQAIGIEAHLEQMPYAELRNKVWRDQDFDAYYANWNYGLSEDICTRFGQPSADVNPEGWYPPEVAALIEQAKGECNFKNKRKIYQKLAKLYHEQAPQIPIDTPRSFVAATSALQGLELSPYMIPCWNITALSIDR